MSGTFVSEFPVSNVVVGDMVDSPMSAVGLDSRPDLAIFVASGRARGSAISLPGNGPNLKLPKGEFDVAV